jgi:hypothetical protein
MLIVFFFLTTSFNSFNNFNTIPNYDNLVFEYVVSNYSDEKLTNFIFLKKDFVGFKELLAYKESTGNYFRINKFGFMGKFQFNLNTLKMYKIKDAKVFLENPKLQERVFLINVQRNKWILRKDIKWFVGTKINNTIITESGIIAAAHLAGPGNVKKYLRSGGKHNPKDAFETSISFYMDYFKGYDITMVESIRKPKI